MAALNGACIRGSSIIFWSFAPKFDNRSLGSSRLKQLFDGLCQQTRLQQQASCPESSDSSRTLTRRKLSRKSLSKMHVLLAFLWGALFLSAGALAQFQFFEQMFQGQQQQQQQRPPQNGPSDSSWYRQQWDNACVSVPHHCPCPHPQVEDKFELMDGKAICVSKGGFKAGEAARKVELARKGLI
ncbi:MAG: Long chronological lifespan protein 2 [Claussenomyces sp. TS43310]|nr:MAG: Long chronological lifespan protein 2 [Claussenomyces sp. TS43310]